MLKKLDNNSVARTQRPVRVLQFGEGNFLRAFCDWIVDLLNEKAAFDSDVQVVQPIRQGMGDAINVQNGLYHLVLNGIQNGKQVQTTRLITCLRDVLNPYEDYEGYLKLAENPDLRFVFSNTTEAGISFNENDRSAEGISESFPGKVTAFLLRRFDHFKGARAKGLYFLPCELIEKNGANLKATVLRCCDHWQLDPAFRRWVELHNQFCNTLVDRIVPGFPKDNISEIQNTTGYEDKLVVMAEPFHLWVIEASDEVQKAFPVHRAGLQVKFVPDLTPYRSRKVRILNGAHTSLVPVAYLHGNRTVREAIDDPFAGAFIRRAIQEEIIPTLDLPRAELEKFAAEVIERFQNPFIRHELSSIALNSISKYNVRVLPSVIRFIELKKTLPRHLLYALACLIRFYKGEWNGTPLPVNDTSEIMAFFKEVWKNTDHKLIVTKVLSERSFWGIDLNELPGVTDFILESLTDIDSNNHVGDVSGGTDNG